MARPSRAFHPREHIAHLDCPYCSPTFPHCVHPISADFHCPSVTGGLSNEVEAVNKQHQIAHIMECLAMVSPSGVVEPEQQTLMINGNGGPMRAHDRLTVLNYLDAENSTQGVWKTPVKGSVKSAEQSHLRQLRPSFLFLSGLTLTVIKCNSKSAQQDVGCAPGHREGLHSKH